MTGHRRRRRSHRTNSRLTLIAIVSVFLLAVMIADQMGLTNHG